MITSVFAIIAFVVSLVHQKNLMFSWTKHQRKGQ